VKGYVSLDRWIVGASLLLLTVLSWLYLFLMADGMKAMTGQGGSAKYMWLMPMGKWDATDFVLGFLMWVIMMIGMMIPSAAPMIFLYAKIRRGAEADGRALALTFIFSLGYFAVWAVFSLAATVLQYFLTEWRLYSDLMETDSAMLSGLILIFAGLYQLTPWKNACLAHCQSPLGFLTHHWRDGAGGAFRMGVTHGWYCLGCCWLIMLVLFSVGVMNLFWIAVLSVFVLLEKFFATGKRVAYTTGVGLVAFGLLRAIRVL
jgi:predicted metal-binding membrane protein